MGKELGVFVKKERLDQGQVGVGIAGASQRGNRAV